MEKEREREREQGTRGDWEQGNEGFRIPNSEFRIPNWVLRIPNMFNSLPITRWLLRRVECVAACV